MSFSAQKHTNSIEANNGFTLIELLMVVGLVAVLAGAAIPSFTSYVKSQNVRQAQEQLKSDLRTVMNKALTGTASQDPEVLYWGLYMTGGQTYYTSFTSSRNSACPPSNGSPFNTKNRVDSDNLPGASVIGGTGSFCVYYDLANGNATFVSSGSFPSCTGNLASLGLTCVDVCDTSGSCKQLGMNGVGLIRNGN